MSPKANPTGPPSTTFMYDIRITFSKYIKDGSTRQARQARSGFRLAAPMTAAQLPVWKEFRCEKVRGCYCICCSWLVFPFCWELLRMGDPVRKLLREIQSGSGSGRSSQRATLGDPVGELRWEIQSGSWSTQKRDNYLKTSGKRRHACDSFD